MLTGTRLTEEAEPETLEILPVQMSESSLAALESAQNLLVSDLECLPNFDRLKLV